MADVVYGAGPLAGVRVVELSHIMAAPTCGLMLSDLGAAVIKVEPPTRGDPQRWNTGADDRIPGGTASFVQVNRGKRSLCLDLKQDAGRDVLMRLVAEADVLVENYRPGVLARMGFGYEALKARFPRLVYASLSGFGRTGPLKDQGGFDLIAQAMSGLMSITGADGGTEPVKCGPPVTDLFCGLLGALGIVSAIAARERTGHGELVDTSLLEGGMMATYWQSAVAFASGTVPRAMGTAHPLYAPYQALPAADGWLALGTANDANWHRLLKILEMPALESDPRFADSASRLAHRHELEAVLAERFGQHTRAEWLDKLSAVGIPAGPVQTVNEMHAHPQTLAREMVVEVPNPVGGTAKAIGCPIKLAESGTVAPRPAPRLGEHGPEILRELGYEEAEIGALVEAGVLHVTGAAT